MLVRTGSPGEHLRGRPHGKAAPRRGSLRRSATIGPMTGPSLRRPGSTAGCSHGDASAMRTIVRQKAPEAVARKGRNRLRVGPEGAQSSLRVPAGNLAGGGRATAGPFTPGERAGCPGSGADDMRPSLRFPASHLAEPEGPRRAAHPRGAGRLSRVRRRKRAAIASPPGEAPRRAGRPRRDRTPPGPCRLFRVRHRRCTTLPLLLRRARCGTGRAAMGPRAGRPGSGPEGARPAPPPRRAPRGAREGRGRAAHPPGSCRLSRVATRSGPWSASRLRMRGLRSHTPALRRGAGSAAS